MSLASHHSSVKWQQSTLEKHKTFLLELRWQEQLCISHSFWERDRKCNGKSSCFIEQSWGAVPLHQHLFLRSFWATYHQIFSHHGILYHGPGLSVNTCFFLETREGSRRTVPRATSHASCREEVCVCARVADLMVIDGKSSADQTFHPRDPRLNHLPARILLIIQRWVIW